MDQISDDSGGGSSGKKTGEDNEQQLNEEGYLDLEALGYLPAPTVVGSINKLQQLHTSRKATNLPLSKMGEHGFKLSLLLQN